MKVDAELVADAVDAAGIDTAGKPAFEADFIATVERFGFFSEAATRAFKLTPAQARDWFDRLAKAFRRVERELEGSADLFFHWPPVHPPDEYRSLFSPGAVEAFSREIAWWRAGSEQLKDLVLVGPGRTRVSGPKAGSAQAAYSLLCRHGVTPTTTAEAPFFRLTEVIFRALTGRTVRKGDGIEAACRAVFASERREIAEQISP